MARPRSTSNRLFISRELLRILCCIFAVRPCLCWVCVRLSVLCLCSIVELHEQVLDVRIKIKGSIAEIVSNSTICVCQPDPRCFGFVAFAHQVSRSFYSCLSRQWQRFLAQTLPHYAHELRLIRQSLFVFQVCRLFLLLNLWLLLWTEFLISACSHAVLLLSFRSSSPGATALIQLLVLCCCTPVLLSCWCSLSVLLLSF